MRSPLRTRNHQDYAIIFLYCIMSRKKLCTYVTGDSVVFFSLPLISISCLEAYRLSSYTLELPLTYYLSRWYCFLFYLYFFIDGTLTVPEKSLLWSSKSEPEFVYTYGFPGHLNRTITLDLSELC